jgi:hypothetical protein
MDIHLNPYISNIILCQSSVVGERMCQEVYSVEIEKGERKLTFFVLLLGVVGAVFDGCGISRPPGAAWVVHLAGECVCGYLLVSSRWGGVGTYFECVWGVST